MRRNWLLPGAFLACLAAGQAQSIFQKAPPGVEEALRARITEFYTLYQKAQFRQAESLVAEQSRDTYYNMQKAPMGKFRVESIKWGPDFKTATVLMAVQDMSPRTAAYELMVPLQGTWKEVQGQWYLVIDIPATTPFGPMSFNNPAAPAKPAEAAPRPTIETFTQGALRLQPQEMSIPMEGGRAERTVTVTNNLPGPLTIELLDPKRPGLELALSASELPSRGQAVLKVTYDPAKGKLRGPVTVPLLVQPIGQRFTVDLLFQ